MGEESLRVFSHTAGDGVLGGEGSAAEGAEGFLIEQRTEVFLINLLYFLILMGCAESVKEVDERYTAFDSAKVGYGAEIHDLLYATLAEHGESCLTAGHDVAVVSKDTQGVGCYGTGADVENAGEQLSGYFVHVGNHEQQALGSSKGGREGTCLERSVDCTGGTAFGLHLLYFDCVAKEIFAALGCPFIDMLRHRTRRSDGINRCHL